MDLNAPTNARNTTSPGITDENITELIDMERVFQAPDLSQENKVLLNEYQRYLKNVWIDGLNERQKGNTGDLIGEHVEFMQRTESALRLFKKAPSLEKEFTALKTLYIKTSESHQELLDTLHQNDVEYETRMKELMPQLQKARREALEECIRNLSEHLKIEISLNPRLSKELRNNLQTHSQALQKMNEFIQSKEELSDDIMRSCGVQMLQALDCLEPIRDYSESALFQQMKDYSKKQAEIKVEIIKTQPVQLIQASNHVKERLHQFKKEFQEPKASERLFSPEEKEQLETLIDKVECCINGIETEGGKVSLKQLVEMLNQMIEAPKLSQEQAEAFQKGIDKAVPHIKTNPELMQALFEINTSMKASVESVPLPQEPDNSQGLAMS
ncbi:MAG: hypothetical protein P4L65_10565 [Legionella sp.]|nr:hypothetical protein [Legionella sp.]